MLAEVSDGVLTAVVTGTGKWLAGATGAGLRGRSVRRESEIAQWFDTYELVDGHYPAPPPEAGEAAVAEWLRGNDVQAVLHELLAVRMTDGPEADVDRLRGLLISTAARTWPSAIGGPVADHTFAWADAQICTLVAKLEARDPQRWRAARTDAFGARVLAVLGAIERHAAAEAGGHDPAADTEWVARYRRQAAVAHGSIEPPDFARRRRVLIADLYVPPEITEPDETRRAVDGSLRSIAFDDLVARIDRTVLLGDPGGGKSTASQVITHRWACDEHERVPFLVVLRDYASGGLGRSVVEHIEERLNAFHQCRPPGGAVERLLLAGSAAVVFDGLDELIDTGRRLEVTRAIEQFCERFPLAPVLVTSRLVGYDEARLDDAQFARFHIAGFSEEKTRLYVRRWFAQEDDVMAAEADDLAGAFMAESEAVADLRSNPLMLALMCILYRGEGTLPRDRPGVYEHCTRLLFDKWDARRRIQVDLRARNIIEPALRHIAYWLFTRDGSPEVTERELVAYTADYFHDRGFEHRHDAEAAAREFVAFCRGRAWIFSDARTTAHGESLYRFTHRTFLEYFAAYQLAGSCDTPEQLASRLAPHVARAEWDVVGQLAVQIKDHALVRGAERIIEKLLGEKRKRSVEGRGNVLAFLARCLAFADPSPAVVRHLARTVMDHFTGGNPNRQGRYRPVMDLVRNAGQWREAVADEVTAVADREVAAGGHTRWRAMPWLTNIDLPANTYPRNVEDDLKFWACRNDELISRYREVILKDALMDDEMWLVALHKPDDDPLLSLAEALTLRDRPPAAILDLVPLRAFGIYLSSLADIVCHETDDIAVPHEKLNMRHCAQLGEWVTGRKPPFFIVAPTGKEDLIPPAYPQISVREGLGPDMFLGLAILLASMVERRGPGAIGPEASLGPLGPYLRHETDNLPDLPVPPRFQDLFRQWARGEVKFVEQVAEPPPP